MAIKSLINPFADFGGIVFGDRFIGRKEAIQQINQRVLGKSYGNLAIMGLPRIGKSSLAWQSIMIHKEELIKDRTIPMFYETGSCMSSEFFFKKMVLTAFNELEFVCDDEKFIRLLSETVKAISNNYDIFNIQKFFRLIKRLDYKLIYIFDEFDSVQSIFDKSDFQMLRELSYNPETDICLVTCSRKTIEDIEIKDGAISNFAGIFKDLRLSVFNKEEVKEYWEHFSKSWKPDDDYKLAISYYTGNHPWIMDRLNYKMFTLDITSDLFRKFDDVKLELMEILDNIVSTIEKENLLNAAIQLIVGPLYDVNSKQIEKLLKYGFIRKVSIQYKECLFDGLKVGPYWDDYAYICFSDYATLDFYRRYYANVPYVSLWSETENLLRTCIKDFISSEFSDSWEKDLEYYIHNNLPFPTFKIDKWEQNLNTLKINRNKMVSNFPNMSGNHLVDFTLTAQIFDIFIRPAKYWFNNHIFTGDWNTWNNKFEFLTKVRNPVAHNNIPQYIQEEIRVATQYCQEISAQIKEWQKERYNTHKNRQ